ncbi:hypothetical protein Patl1_04430 [Pistacia atlantica]|uniref:Uncharacterized protein n=1 Tax=Pistacia atlantica TaxID=434234 RepID=A0ACC1BU95_9ROSI|nr:hypothetical protein Patl1_04430 [Pistacia atlantica]
MQNIYSSCANLLYASRYVGSVITLCFERLVPGQMVVLLKFLCYCQLFLIFQLTNENL